MTTTSTELTTKNPSLPQTIHSSENLTEAGISVTDLKPNYLSLQQKMSKAVDQGICKAGDILETPVNVVVGGEGKPAEVFPLFTRKEWVSYYLDQKDNKPFRRVPYSSANAHWKYRDFIIDENGKKREIKNDLSTIWYMLPVGDGALPVIVTFRGNSSKAGNNIIQMVARLGMAGKATYFKSILLESVKESNEKGTFYVFKASFGRDATNEELENSSMWQKMFSKKPPVPPVNQDADEDVSFP